jgi:hypothetical protein
MLLDWIPDEAQRNRVLSDNRRGFTISSDSSGARALRQAS